MIAPYKWLCDYIDMNLGPEALSQKLIATGTAVEGYTELGLDIQKVVAGKIIKLEKHPDADKLSVCDVDVGEETLQIVCGANNIFEGALVPVALIGANLPGGLKIKKGKLRGVYSHGMLCSGAELNLTGADYPGADVDGIMILKEDVPLGTTVREILGLTDTVFEIEIESNRPDCLSMLGIARECAASLETNVNLPDTSYTEAQDDIVTNYVGVTVNDCDLCERYIARAVKNVKIGPSPKWLKDRLISAGVRSINNIVDITNFVMLETGQPMHAFDHKDIRGSHIDVRRAQNGEKIVTLDDKERELTDDMLLICDAEGPIAIGGVMGGQNSEIKDDTQTIIFEAAKFSQANVRRTSRSLGLASESSMRFSKGVDTAGCKTAMNRALHLVELLGAGDVVGGEIDILSADLSPRTVTVDAEKINARLGTSMHAKDMAALLRRVFIETDVDGNTLTCAIPSYRGDISIGEDISEEVARMFGYNNIPNTKMTGEVIRGVVPPEEQCVDRIREVLVGLGCFECVTYSFAAVSEMDKLRLDEDDKLRRMVKILNPLGDEQGYLRTSPVPDMLKVVANNLNMKVNDVRLFETGRIYLPEGSSKELPDEQKYVCIALCGDEDYFALKGVVENLLESFGISKPVFAPEAGGYYHPGRKATVYADGEKLGEMGEIHPDVASAYDIDKRIYLAELNVHEIASAGNDVRKYTALPRFPAAERDLALIVGETVSAAALQDCIEQNAGEFFESAALFDVYSGAPIEQGKKSMAFSIVFRAPDRTLLDEEANDARDRIVAAAHEAFEAKIRD